VGSAFSAWLLTCDVLLGSLEQMMKQMSGKNGMPDMSALQSMMGGMGGFPGK
jgi:hypothetical protein